MSWADLQQAAPQERGCGCGRPDLKSEPATRAATKQVPGGGRQPGPAPGRHSQTRGCSRPAKQGPRKPNPRQHLSEHLRLCWGQDRPPERPLRKCQVGLARVCLWRPRTLCRKPALCFSGAQRPVSLKPQAWVIVHEPWGPWLVTTSSTPYPTAGQCPRSRSSGRPVLRCSLKASPATGLPPRMCPHTRPWTMGPSDSADRCQRLPWGRGREGLPALLSHS